MCMSVNVVIATYQRPDRLQRALDSLAAAARHATAKVTVAVTVVDDDPQGSAAPVVRGMAESFDGDCIRVDCGQRNISAARNAGIEYALDHAECLASIDDDVVVPLDWFDKCAGALASGEFDAVTGPLVKDFSQGPAWLTEQPFERLGLLVGTDGEPAFVCATGNNWMRSSFLRDHPEVRFDEALGRTGGEDMDFFYRAVRAGLRPVYSTDAAVIEREPVERCTFRYQLRRSFWLGLSEAQINLRLERAGRMRLLARAGRRAVERGRRQLPELDRARSGIRYQMSILAQSLGLTFGALGFRMTHK